MTALRRSLELCRPANKLFTGMVTLLCKTEYATVARLAQLAEGHNGLTTTMNTAAIFGNPQQNIRSRMPVTEQIMMMKRKKPQQQKFQQKKHSLVIFDKDGTLICFHAMWVPWARSTVQRLYEQTHLDIGQRVYKLLGFCPLQERVETGLLAHGTMRQIRDAIGALLVEMGVERKKAIEIVRKTVLDCDTSSPETIQQVHDLQNLFVELKARQVKIAICTADSREATVSTLRMLQLEHLVDFVMCGDDRGSKPKPNPHNALHICRMLGVAPEEALMVGDTPADLHMSKRAKLGTTVGVLSGIGQHTELGPHADHILNHVGELLPLMFLEENYEKRLVMQL